MEKKKENLSLKPVSDELEKNNGRTGPFYFWNVLEMK